MQFHEDDRAQRLLDIFPTEGQVNVSYVNSTNHVTAWHRHFKQTDYWICLKGSFKVGICDGTIVNWHYISDKNQATFIIKPGLWHGYKALEPNSILLYYVTRKYDPNDEIKVLPGHFGENWETISK